MPSSDDKESVNWEDIAYAGDDIFNVWFGNPELLWAKAAWQKLQEAGLTAFGTELERHVVLCRLLVLGGSLLIADVKSASKDVDGLVRFPLRAGILNCLGPLPVS